MYDAVADPYCYDGTTVLKNIPSLRTQAELDAFEAISTATRANAPLPAGHFSVKQYQAIHRHLFQDVYKWAGRYRTVRLGKDGSAFCYPDHIAPEMTKLFADLKAKRYLGLRSADAFASAAAEFLATLNAIHPFREGNGRTQTSFLALIADHAGHPLDLNRLERDPFLAAMVVSFKEDITPLAEQIRLLIA